MAAWPYMYDYYYGNPQGFYYHNLMDNLSQRQEISTPAPSELTCDDADSLHNHDEKCDDEIRNHDDEIENDRAHIKRYTYCLKIFNPEKRSKYAVQKWTNLDLQKNSGNASWLNLIIKYVMIMMNLKLASTRVAVEQLKYG